MSSTRPAPVVPASALTPGRYRPFRPVDLPDRTWPNRTLDRAPVWCSVDLRDGNQALVEPMGAERKRRMFELLVRLGVKEIEVGFPAASETDFAFVRQLVEEDLVPADVTIQVLTQARAELIARTYEAIRGARRAIVHLYNSTSALQRRVVFGLDRAGIVAIATRGATLVADHAASLPGTEVTFQYSPESFTGTELDFAVEISEAVMEVWQPTPARRAILNLPSTVELSTPNVYADQIEWFGRHFRGRDRVVLSVHTHNDRGTGIAATELALLAGAERVEGTLFGNGERTGNADLVTLALNLYTQGVDPGLDLSDLPAVVRTVEHCNQMPVPPRHPYGGELVFTAFSGSHQDAINKGLAALPAGAGQPWEVPYLTVDPRDLGRTYEAVIRINSQSGKGGVAYILKTDYGFDLPRPLQIDFSRVVQRVADQTGGEIAGEEIWRLFRAEYLEAEQPYRLREHHLTEEPGDRCTVEAVLTHQDRPLRLRGTGNGPIAAFVDGLPRTLGLTVSFRSYSEHALGEGADTSAAAYVELAFDGQPVFGVGRHPSIVSASLVAIVAALNRASRLGLVALPAAPAPAGQPAAAAHPPAR